MRILEQIGLVLLLLVGDLLDTSAASASSGGEPWREVLTTLNEAQTIAKSDDSIPGHAWDVDLVKRHEAEITELKQLWRPLETVFKAQGLDKKSLRTRRLEFFQTKLQGMNQASLAFLHEASKPGIISEADAASILKNVRQHHVASLDRTREYQRADEIGFCFGRALLVHYFLLKAGVPQHHIAKIFTLGDLKVGNSFWRFHVAVLLKTRSGFVMMDPLHPRPMPVQEWLQINEKYSVKAPWSEVRFHVTDPRKFLPAPGQYAESTLQHPVYQGYFRRLVNSLNN